MYTGLLFFFIFVGCCAASPADSAQGIRCGEIPSDVYSCLGNPRLISSDVSHQCDVRMMECDRMKCIFNKSGWLDGEKINKKKVSDHFDQFAAEHPAWSPAVNHLKAACLNPDHDVPAQGVFLNCPAYDIMQCAISSFIKNATPSQWKATASCQQSRSYAAACPVCPSDCFAPQVPYGTCNACLSLPRST